MAIEFIPDSGDSPLSKAVAVNGLLFTSGQVGRRADGSVPSAFVEQLEQALLNLDALLSSANSGLDRVVKLTAFVTADGWSTDLNETYRRFLKAPYPARTRVEVARLSPGYLVELDAIAMQNPDESE